MWAAGIFLGPKLLSYALNYKFQDQIKVFDLTITPKLGLKAARVELNGLVVKQVGILNGASRGIDLSWGWDGVLSPKVSLVVGPTIISDRFEIDSARVEISPRQHASLGTLVVEATADYLDSKFFGSVQSLDFKAQYETKTNLLTNVKMTSTQTQNAFNQGFDVSILSVDLDRLNMAKSLKQQNIDGLILLEDISSDLYGVSIRFGQFDINFKENNLSTKIIVPAMEVFNLSSVQDAEISIDVSLKQGLEKGLLSFSIPSITLPSYHFYSEGSSVNSFSGDLSFDLDGNYNLNGEATLSDVQLERDGFFLADLSNTKIYFNAAYPHLNDGNLIFEVKSSLRDGVSYEGDTTIRVEDAKLEKCIFLECEQIELNSNYKLIAGRGELVGAIYCPWMDCANRNAKHNIKIKNPKIFFDAIAASKILNPLIIASIYSQLSLNSKHDGTYEFNF